MGARASGCQALLGRARPALFREPYAAGGQIVRQSPEISRNRPRKEVVGKPHSGQVGHGHRSRQGMFQDGVLRADRLLREKQNACFAKKVRSHVILPVRFIPRASQAPGTGGRFSSAPMYHCLSCVQVCMLFRWVPAACGFFWMMTRSANLFFACP